MTARGHSSSETYPQRTVPRFAFSYLLYNSVVSGPIRMIESSNDSHVSCGFPDHFRSSLPDTVSTRSSTPQTSHLASTSARRFDLHSGLQIIPETRGDASRAGIPYHAASAVEVHLQPTVSRACPSENRVILESKTETQS